MSVNTRFKLKTYDSKLNSDYDQSDELLCQLTQDLNLKLMTLN
jgi:hypothetical protein